MGAMGPRLELRQSQALVITPQLQAAIKLLTLSNLELAAHIESELAENPLLELADPDGPRDAADAGGAPDADAAPEPPADADLLDGLGTEAVGDATDADMAAERFHHDGPADAATGAGGAGGEEDLDLDGFAAPAGSLHAHLLAQARAALAGGDLAIAEHLIDAIDDAGYLTVTLAEIAERLSTAEARVEAVLAAIHRFEPTGVGARDLAECLRLQCIEADRHDPCMAALLDHLDLVARGDLAALRRACGVDAEDLADMLRELRALDPKPGLAFGGDAAPGITPDVFVRRARGGWAVELNNATLPRLIINRQYQARLAAGAKPARAFAAEQAGRAQWLVRTLDQRAGTILKVATELVRAQQGFFERGITGLKPMTLRAIADAVGLHESTVSRVTANKYLSCERGTFELKWFFTTAIPATSGDASAEAVRDRIRALIAGEDPLKPLSDDRLMELLDGEGFTVARRTVAKYREALGLASSFDRRRRALLTAA